MSLRDASFETLELEWQGPVLRVWLNRPEKLNALNRTALEEIEEVFGALQGDFETRVVVLGGRGRAFCAGADRGDPPGLPSADAGARERRYASQLGLRASRAIEEVEAVTIARVQGHAVGGGCVLAAACDFRVATKGARFHVPEVDLGIPLTWGATPRLINELGAARARELILLCEEIDGTRAFAWGLVHRVVPEAELDVEVDALVEKILAKPEAAVHATKTQFRAYALRGRLGDVTETDGDVLVGALREAAARAAFPRPRKGGAKQRE
ncbi:MAG: enoyl-CoA hydratase/isomerase family protein [Myxococcota bacterium]